jgi:hypothetical protein
MSHASRSVLPEIGRSRRVAASPIDLEQVR